MSYRLTELQSSHLEYFGSLRGKSGHLAHGLFIAEGPKVVPHVLDSSCEVPYAYLTREYFERYEALLSNRSGEETAVHVATKEDMESVVGYALHQGVMVAARIPEPPALEDLLHGEVDHSTLLVLDGIADAENMGALVRTAAAFGVQAIVYDSTSCHPFLRRSVRVSMGTVINLPLVRVNSLPETLRELRDREAFHVYAAALTEDSALLANTMFADRSALVFGAEGTGITRQVLAVCDHRVRIEMAQGVDSLNVGVACGAFLYERFRQFST